MNTALISSPDVSLVRPVSNGLFGYNIEITRRGCWRGLSAEMVANRKFAALGKDEFPLHWESIGDGDAASLCETDGYAGNHSIAICQRRKGCFVGVVQEAETLNLAAGRGYALRLAIQVSSPMEVVVRFVRQEVDCCCRGNMPVVQLTWTVEEPGPWQLLQKEFISPVDGVMRLEIGSQTLGTFRIGAVSLMPSDAFYGMRRDVVEQLKSLRPAALRFPGGCYAEFYRWRDALLPVDQRPPIGPTGLWFLLPDSDDYDNHDIGINEFLLLCQEVGAAPSLTVRMNESQPQDAADLVEYCNGGADTSCGAMRIALGLENSPRVHTWFIGNELWSFGHEGLDKPEVCAEQTALFAQAMRARDASIQLIGCSYYDHEEWNGVLVRKAGEYLDGYSLHSYLLDVYLSGAKCGRLGSIALAPQQLLRPFLKRVKDGFSRLLPDGRDFSIVFDEWNFRWGIQGNTGMAVYVAGVLHLLFREAAMYHIDDSYFFMAINEGIIEASGDQAKLDAAGIIFNLCRPHAGQYPMTVASDDSNLDIFATCAQDKKQACITILNRNVSEPISTRLRLQEIITETVTITSWMPLRPDTANRTYALEQCRQKPVPEDNCLDLTLEPAAFMQILLQ